MSFLPKRQPGAALSRAETREMVEVLVDADVYKPVLGKDGKPGLELTDRGRRAGVAAPLSDPNHD